MRMMNIFAGYVKRD